MRNPNIVVTESTTESINAPLQVLARLDPDGKACIFNPSTMHGQMIDCWHLGDTEPQPVPVYYYLSTKPLDDKINKRSEAAKARFEHDLAATSAAMQDVTAKAWSEGLDDATLQLAVKIAKILRETH